MTFERGAGDGAARTENLKDLERLESLEEKFTVECEQSVVNQIRAIIADSGVVTPTQKSASGTPRDLDGGAVDSGK